MKVEKASRRVFKYIEKMILEKKWKVGEKISSETLLAKELEVSRISVREAIGSLETLNILERKRGGGTYVKQVTPNGYMDQLMPFLVVENISYLETMETRLGLDIEAATLFTQRATDEEIEGLGEILTHMKTNNKLPEKFYEKDAEFHRYIGKFSQNKILEKITNMLFDITTHYGKGEYHSLDYDKRIKEHRDIYNAIKQRDIDLVKLYCSRHIKRTIDELKEVKYSRTIKK